MDALECLKTRRCVRLYKQGEIPREVIKDIVECGRRAATAINIQPWHFIIITNKDMLSKIADITDHGKFIANASCCIAVFCEKVKYYIEDGSAATQNILLAAHAHGLASCWVAGDKKDYCSQIADVLRVPDNVTLVSLVPLGYSDTTPALAKKPIEQMLHWEKF